MDRALLLAAAAVALWTSPVQAAGTLDAPSPAPGSSTLAPALCPVRVDQIVALDAGADGRSATYAIALRTLDGGAGSASGTLALFAGDERFGATFGPTIALAEKDAAPPSPIVVRFPSPVFVDSAYVASLAGPDAGPCVPIIIRSAVKISAEATAEANALVERARTTKPIDTDAGTSDPPPACEAPYRPAAMTHVVGPEIPTAAVAERLSGESLIKVFIADDGAVLQATVFRSSGSAVLDQAARAAAEKTTYAPEAVLCRPSGGFFMYRADFNTR